MDIRVLKLCKVSGAASDQSGQFPIIFSIQLVYISTMWKHNFTLLPDFTMKYNSYTI